MMTGATAVLAVAATTSASGSTDIHGMATSQRYITAAGTETRTATAENRLYELLEHHD